MSCRGPVLDLSSYNYNSEIYYYTVPRMTDREQGYVIIVYASECIWISVGHNDPSMYMHLNNSTTLTADGLKSYFMLRYTFFLYRFLKYYRFTSLHIFKTIFISIDQNIFAFNKIFKQSLSYILLLKFHIRLGFNIYPLV